VKKLRARAIRAASFSANDWRILCESTFTLVGMHLALRLVGFPRVVSWAARTRTARSTTWSSVEVEHAARFVATAGRLTGLLCLPRALTLTRMLARRGVTTKLRIGVRPEGDELLAHAWVEWMGRALNDDEASLQRFAPFERALDGISNV